jgi:putative toxin-antitoxin system antitoxin component (TIGR02293 family)
MATTQEIVAALGGSKAIGGAVTTLEALHERIRQGLPYATLEHMAEILSVSLEEIGQVLALPRRTRARRRAGERLEPIESDRLVRLARVAASAESVLGGWEKAAQWLVRPNRALGGKVPLRLLDTEVGELLVDEVLGRIEHGVVS